MGILEVYDSNIYLEDDSSLPSLVISDEILLDPEFNPAIPKQIDRDPNSDLITSISLGVNGSLPYFTSYAKTGIEAKVGTLFFGDATDESRLTVDTNIAISAEDGVLPDPFTLSLRSSMSSRSGDVGVAEGTGARQSQTHDAVLSLGIKEVALGKQTGISATYSFNRRDFLGEFTFNDDDQEQQGQDVVDFDEVGQDWFSHSFSVPLTHRISERTSFVWENNVNLLSFSSSSSDDPDANLDADLDRLNFTTTLGVNRVVSEKLFVFVSAGIELTNFLDEPSQRIGFIPNGDGTNTQITIQPDDQQSNLTFLASVNYLPFATTSFNLLAQPSAGTDIDGDRLLVRTIDLSGSQLLGDKASLGLGAQLLQFNSDDSLSESTDRVSLQASMRYSLTEAVSVVLGYSYTVQDEGGDPDPFQRSNDYDVSRAFISLDAGLIALPG